ncbi:MAG: hypothetical protein K2P14_05310, partial [Anaeroplasmataceae bacterium]|nr:hypothetical protein [Anaeroplasmataceae bacterium]
MERKRIWIVICILEVVILGILILQVIKDIKNSKTVDTSISDWRSQYIEYNDGWYVNEEILQVDKPITVIYGPGINLPKGTYSIHIDYECDYNQSCEASAGLNEDSFVKAGTAILSKNKSEIVYQISIKEDVEEFLVKIQYNGRGMLGVKDITITKDSMGSRKSFLSFLLIFLIIDIGFYFSEQIVKNKKICMALLGITILSSLPLMIKGIGNGHDLPFHLVRIEAIADSIHLSEWSMPVRISNLWYDGYGYPTSIYYGELLLYIPAFFRIMGFSVEEAYKVYVFLINAGTTIISYVCFGKVFLKKNIALLTCMVYMTATYRMVNLYVRAAVGEYSAMMFFPIIALAIYRIYTGNCEDKVYEKNALLLAIGMTGLIETHILSTEIVLFTLILICFIFCKKTLRKNTLKTYSRAIM